MPSPDRESRMTAKGSFSHQNFAYDAEEDADGCPKGALPNPPIQNSRAARPTSATSTKADSMACPLCARCLAAKGERLIRLLVDGRHRTSPAATRPWPSIRLVPCSAVSAIATSCCAALPRCAASGA